MTVEVTVNGTAETLAPDRDFASALRDAGYTDVKCGCDGGTCGASKVLVDDEVVMACGTTTEAVAGAEIETVAALGTQEDLHPIQQAFVDHFAVQCGFCIPGMIMQAKALLAENPDPSEAEVRAALSDNVCRCTGYEKPIAAILDAAGRMRGEPPAAPAYQGVGDRGAGDARGGEASD
ncbi:MAG: (2Fe-2S)-binding protein [Haloarculaceae archaeon]